MDPEKITTAPLARRAQGTYFSLRALAMSRAAAIGG
jgi:hypothetical protein